jgi:hypothetical protein
MKQVTRGQVAAAFRDAKERVYNPNTGKGTETYICLALGSLSRYKSPAQRVAIDIIERRINMGACISVELWLIKNAHVKYWATTNDMQVYRHRWLASLIKEFSRRPGQLIS